VKDREEYIREYLASARKFKIDLEPPAQQIEKTAEAAWAIDSYSVEPSDEPADRSPPRRTE
jgi:hypothetical protein